jgi:putative FmdB family regulatory protein
MTYEYVCTACGHGWEAEQPISAAPLKECPSCHEQSAKRQVSGGAGFILKGSGWYADLYSSAKPAPKEGAAEAKDSGKTDSKSDAKTEKKTDAAASAAPSTSSAGDSSSSTTSSSTSTKPANAATS